MEEELKDKEKRIEAKRPKRKVQGERGWGGKGDIYSRLLSWSISCHGDHARSSEPSRFGSSGRSWMVGEWARWANRGSLLDCDTFSHMQSPVANKVTQRSPKKQQHRISPLLWTRQLLAGDSDCFMCELCVAGKRWRTDAEMKIRDRSANNLQRLISFLVSLDVFLHCQSSQALCPKYYFYGLWDSWTSFILSAKGLFKKKKKIFKLPLKLNFLMNTLICSWADALIKKI